MYVSTCSSSTMPFCWASLHALPPHSRNDQ
jgi:hypothetical protein